MNYQKLNDITGATKNEKDKYYVYGLYEEGEFPLLSILVKERGLA